jgi:hypothetical protein
VEHRDHVRSKTGPPRQPKSLQLQYDSDGDEAHHSFDRDEMYGDIY